MRATSPHVLHTLLWLVPFVKLHHYNEFARDLLFYAHHWFRDLLIRFLSVFSRDRSQTRKGPSISCLRRISVANFIRKPNLCLRMAMWPLANQILFKNPLQRHDGSHRRPFFFFKKSSDENDILVQPKNTREGVVQACHSLFTDPKSWTQDFDVITLRK